MFQLIKVIMLLSNINWFSIKTDVAHYPVIQKKVNMLLAKDAIETSTDVGGFYSNVLLVSKCRGGLCPIVNLKHFNCYMHIPTFEMPAINKIWQLIQHGDYAFCIDLKEAYLHIPIVKCQHHFTFYLAK